MHKHSHSVQHDEFRLVLHDWVPPPTGHLGDSVDTPNEDDAICRENRGDEHLEFHARDEINDRLTPTASSSKRPMDIFAAQNAKHEQGKHLEDNPRHHEVVARGCTRVGVSGRGQSSARALEDQGKQIAEDEDPGVVLGRESRIFLPDSQDDMLQGEIDCCRKESLGRVSHGRCGCSKEVRVADRRDNQAADLDVEARHVEWIGV